MNSYFRINVEVWSKSQAVTFQQTTSLPVSCRGCLLDSFGLPARGPSGPPQSQVVVNSLIFHAHICVGSVWKIGLSTSTMGSYHLLSHCGEQGFPPDPELPSQCALWTWSHRPKLVGINERVPTWRSLEEKLQQAMTPDFAINCCLFLLPIALETQPAGPDVSCVSHRVGRSSSL